MLPRSAGSGKSVKADGSVALDALEVVIVHPQGHNAPNGRIGGGHNSCCRRHGARKRHNATQTNATHLDSCCCCRSSNDCFSHGELEMSCHCHITHHHHCHHHYSPAATAESTKRRALVRTRRHRHRHHHQAQEQDEPQQPHLHTHSHSHQHLHSHHRHSKHASEQLRRLPAGGHKANSNKHTTNDNKSSLDSSDEQLPQQRQQQQSMMHQTIAIEIDAATMTEDNSSTATSNFPYKVASEGGGVPIILAPLREQHRQRPRRRGSLNSNTTIETDELSQDADDDDDDDDDVHIAGLDADADDDADDDDEAQLTPRRNKRVTANGAPSSSSSTARACAGALPRNECVRIKRKRFMPDAVQDYCSSCSRCSSCSCGQERTSSCSSLDDLGDDMRAHELTVAAECHHCNLQPQEPVELEPTNNNAVTSRRSSVSFGSCHTSSCCCCNSSNCEEEEGHNNDDEDDEDETTGQRESFCTAADHTIKSTVTPLGADAEDCHSSTLTPLTTQHSSLLEEDNNAEHTMRSEGDGGAGTLTDADASSLSQSAEYYSVSSAAAVQPSLTKCCLDTTHCGKPCKHWSKHHSRHKRSSSPLDSHL